MPLDPSIALAARSPVPLEDPINQYAKVAQIKGMMDASQLSGLQRQALENQLQEHDRVLAAFNGMQPGQSIEDVLPQVYAASPTTGIAMSKNILDQKKTQADLELTKLKTHAEQVKELRDDTARLAPGDDAGLASLKEKAVKLYGPQAASNFPASTMDPAFKQWQAQNVMDANTFLERIKPVYQVANLGGESRVVQVNPNAPGAQTEPMKHTATPGEIMTDQRQRELNGILAGQTPADTSATVKAIASYETPLPPRPSGARNQLAAQRWDQLLAAVKKENPDYNAQNYSASQKAYNAFTSGQQGNAIRSFSVAMSHLDTLQKLADALKNGDAQLINKLSNTYKEQTGNPAPTNFDAAKQIVADEVVKAIVGSGSGALGDREEAARTIRSQSSPAQLAGTIGTYKELMAGQLGGLRRQYEQSTYRKDFDRFLSDEAKTQLEKHVAPSGGKAPATQTFNSMPDPKQYVGRRIQGDDGTIYKSDGAKWVKQ